jgi:hypothetical protein
MPTLLFVHGTGVREESHAKTLAVIQARVGARADVLPCYWGDLGSSLGANGRSIPTYDSTRGLESALVDWSDPEDDQGALWERLRWDPFLELRALALKPRRHGLPPWQQTPGKQLMEEARQLEPEPSLKKLLLEGGIDPLVFGEAQRRVSFSPPFQDALAEAEDDMGDCRGAIARAWIAAAARLVQRATLEETGEMLWPVILLDAGLRDRVESGLLDALGGAERGVGGWLSQALLALASWPVTSRLAHRRGAISDVATPMAGDILLYQARGEAIRARIRDQILAAGGPVVLLAHSLGGVACVDLLATETLPVHQLITVGSQAPFLYEINALRSLPFGEPLPASMPPWLNLYDLRDVLSYLGEGVFPGSARVVDRCVNNCQAFPASHSAYWWNEEVWDVILPTLSP